MCGGPSAQQQAVQNQAIGVAGDMSQRQGTAFNAAMPYYTNLMNNGVPYTNMQTDYAGGSLAQAAAPQRNALVRSAMGAGISPNDPAYLKTMGDFNVGLSQQFDNNILSAMRESQAAKQSGAAGLVGLAQANNPAQMYSITK